MICRDFVHIGIGDTLEGVVRNALQNYVYRPVKPGEFDGSMIPWDNIHTDAHLTVKRVREWTQAPAFTFTRNPYDWYISAWIHHLKMKQWEGRFCDWMATRKGWFTETWIHHTFLDGKEAVAHVGQCEHLEDDLVIILNRLSPKILSKEFIYSWFPEAYKQWCNRPWVEAIEQHMRFELYSKDLIIQVEEGDGWALDRWGYRFGQKHKFSRPGDD